MDLLAAWLLFPAALIAVTLGCGLLVDRVAGGRVPGALLVPLGLATVLAVSRFLTAFTTTARVALPALLILALAGLVLGRRRLALKGIARWPVAVGVALFAVYGAPAFLTGDATFVGYTLLPDTSHQLSLADLLASRGPDYQGLPRSSNQLGLSTYIDSNYPVAPQAALGVLAPLGALDLAWLYQPFLSFLAAMLGLSIWSLLSGVIAARPLRALVAFVAAQPALTVSFVLQGSIKEISGLSMIVLGAALVAAALRRRWPARAFVSPALAAVAAFGSLGPAAAPYVLLLAGALAAPWAWRLRRTGSRPRVQRELLTAGGVAGLSILLALPILREISTAVAVNTQTLQTLGDLGNLPGPLNPAQVMGIWLNGDYRYVPDNRYLGFMLIGIGVAAGLLGFVWILRRRALGPLVMVGLFAVVSLLLVWRGNAYADSKVYMLAAPAALLCAMLGAISLRDAGRGIEAALLVVFLTGTVLASNALTYHDAHPAPHARYSELLRIDERLEGRGPVIFTEYDEFGKYFLRRADSYNQPEYPHAYRPEFSFEDTRRRPSLKSPLDLDELKLSYIQSVRFVVLRRSPTVTRPPSNFRLMEQGTYYEVWERAPGSAGRVRAHLPLGADVFNPGAPAPCADVTRMAREAERIGGRLAYAPRPKLTIFRPRTAPPSAAWFPYAAYPGAIVPQGPGRVEGPVELPAAGRYTVWMEGSFGRRFDAYLDGRPVGEVSYELGNPGQYLRAGTASAQAGPHTLRLVRRGGDLRPGNGGSDSSLRHLGPVVFSPPENEQRPVREMAPSQARSLCGRRLDWLEVVAPA